MSSDRRRNCRACGRHESECGPISWAGYCIEDGLRIKNENAVALHYKRGPQFDHWRRRCLAAFGVGIFEDVES
jgi:hypothetical protein